MHHIQGCDRNQTLLLPNSVDDYIGADNPVRFIEAFVEQLDLRGAGFCRVEPNETGGDSGVLRGSERFASTSGFVEKDLAVSHLMVVGRTSCLTEDFFGDTPNT